MTYEQQKAKELAELLTAFADGKQLQYESDRFGWCATTSLGYIADSVIDNKRQIRIKPETKRVPLTKEDLIERIKNNQTIAIIDNQFNTIHNFEYTTIDNSIKYCGYESAIPFAELMLYSSFADGTPCYKEVESE